MDQVFIDIPPKVYQEVRNHLLYKHHGLESTCFLFVTPLDSGSGQLFKYVEWFPVLSDGFKTRTNDHLELNDETRSKVIKRAHDLEASIVEFHSHTGASQARFSYVDQLGLSEFVPHIMWRLRGKPYFAVVVTENDFDGLAWTIDSKTPQHLDGIRVDEKTHFSNKLSSLNMNNDRYERNIRFFGQQGQTRLSDASVAVVGVGGLGTHVIQQLALLGIGRLVLIDHEEVETTNLNRYIGVRPDDIGDLKVSIASRLINEINPLIHVSRISEPLFSSKAFDELIRSGYVFGCVDNDAARLVLNELCSAYAKPYFDLATDVLDDGNQYGGRVCVSWKGNGCIDCYGELDKESVSTHFMSPDAKRDRKSIYGVPKDALNEAGPSVVSINGVVASMGVTEFMLAVTGLRKPKGLIRYHGRRGVVNTDTSRPSADCYYCSAIRGKGDEANVQRYIRSSN